VLVVAARRELRQQVREAIRHMGLIVDFVPSVAEAAAFCDGGPPHAVVYEAALGGERLESLRRRIREQAPDAAFIEIAEEGDGFETSGADGAAARVGRDAIRTALPSALLHELTKAL
jgi:DNA-binding response OmpR family regulator